MVVMPMDMLVLHKLVLIVNAAISLVASHSA